MFTESQQQELYAQVLAQRCLLEALLQRHAALSGGQTGAGGLDDVQCRARFLLHETTVPGLTPEQLDSLRRRAGVCLDEIDARARPFTL